MADAWTFLRQPSLSRLWAAARRKVEADGEVKGAVGLPDPTDDERRALAGLLGRPKGRGRRERVDLVLLDAHLRETAVGVGLLEVLARMGGPLRDRPAERAATANRRVDALASLNSSRHSGERWFGPWLETVVQSGRLARLDQTGQLDLLAAAGRVLDALPSDGVAIGVLAHQCTGDPKALDKGPLAGLVLSALAACADQPAPSRQLDRRLLWERFGVVRDELSSQVLVLDLPARPEGMLGTLLATARGEPFRVTLRQLVRHPLRVEPATITIFENPVVIREAAERGLGWPVVCTEGQPSAACIRLLRTLRDQGCALRAHADFDAAGLHIVRRLIEETGAEPWRFGEEEYRRALESGGHARVGSGLVSPWDPGLAAAMEAEGRGIYEEAVIDELLGDR